MLNLVKKLPKYFLGGNAQLCGCVSCDNAPHQTYYKLQLIVAVNIKAELSQVLNPLFYNKDRSLQI